MKSRIMLSVVAVFAALAIVQTNCSAEAKRMSQEDVILKLIDEIPPLENDLGDALPIRGSQLGGWLPEDDDEAKAVLRQLHERGLATCPHPAPGNAGRMAQALRMGRLQQELGLEVGINASSAMYGFFNGDESTFHVAEDGELFYDDTFGGRKMGCPFRLDHRKDDIKADFRSLLGQYQQAGIEIDFMYLDWEIDGPIEWNGAWSHSKRCRVCTGHVPDIEDFGAFQDALRTIRSQLQRECCAEVVQSYFPDALIGNYSVYPHNGTRYWYDYYEELPPDAPHEQDQLAQYRPWYDEFEPCGYTFANPVCYTWYPTYGWYPEFDSDDYRWFYNMLLVGTNAGEHTPQDVPLITWVHWHTTAPPQDAEPVPQMSEWAYQEFLWHLFLRGTDGLMMWCRREETTTEIRLMTEVYDGVLEHREFLQRGEPVFFDVPSEPGTVISALRLDGRLLVRRTDFADASAPVTRRIGDQTIEIPRRDGQCQIIQLQ